MSVTVMCIVVPQHKTTNNGTSDDGGGSGSTGDNASQVTNAVKTRYCTLGLFGECMANEHCVARRRPTVMRIRSGLCRCMPGFVREPRTGLCIDGRQ